MDKLKKNSKLKHTNGLSESSFFVEKDQIPTDVPMMNVALSGSIKVDYRKDLLFWRVLVSILRHLLR